MLRSDLLGEVKRKKSKQIGPGFIARWYKILKRYLRYHKPTSFLGVQRVVDLFVYDYGSLRPHGALKGLTPMERYVDPARTLDLCPAILGARARRIEENKRVNCSLCLKTTAKVGRTEERR